MGRQRRLLVATVAVGLLPAAQAHADLVAAYDRPVSGRGTDIALINASTGRPIALPTGVNTFANETHPSLSPDGSLLVFQRGAAVVRFPLRGGGFPRVFSGPTTRPYLLPAVGGAEDQIVVGRGTLNAAGSATSDTFAHATLLDPADRPRANAFSRGPADAGAQGRGTVTPSLGFFSLMAWSTSERISRGLLPAALTYDVDLARVVETIIVRPPFPPQPTGIFRAEPLAQLSGTTSRANIQPDVIRVPPVRGFSGSFIMATFEAVPLAFGGSLGPGNIKNLREGSAVLSVPSGSASDPAAINTTLHEGMPSWTDGGTGRYLGFIRTRSDGHRLLQVFDTDSQRLINTGIDLRADQNNPERRIRSNLSLVEDRTRFDLDCDGTSSSLACDQSNAGVPVGIQVFRVTGRRRLFGRRVPRLREVGVIKLGKLPRHFRVRPQRIRINGRRLRPGRYRIFVRSRTRNGRRVRALSDGVRLVVRRRR